MDGHVKIYIRSRKEDSYFLRFFKSMLDALFSSRKVIHTGVRNYDFLGIIILYNSYDMHCCHTYSFCRKYDLKLCLSGYNDYLIPNDDPCIQRFVEAVALPEPGKLTFTPHNEKWKTTSVRQKKRHTYRYVKKDYMVIASDVSLYYTKLNDQSPLTVEGNEWKKYHELEV